MARQVKLDMDSGHHQTVTVPEGFKIHDVLITAESPSAWVIIPTVTGGAFAARAGTILSIAVEDDEVVNGGSS
jgi:hypothetical protein